MGKQKQTLGWYMKQNVSLVDESFSIMQLIEVRINHVHVLFEDTLR